MSDFSQNGIISSLHDFGTKSTGDIEKDLFPNWEQLNNKPSKILVINPKINNYIHIFPKNKNRRG